MHLRRAFGGYLRRTNNYRKTIVLCSSFTTTIHSSVTSMRFSRATVASAALLSFPATQAWAPSSTSLTTRAGRMMMGSTRFLSTRPSFVALSSSVMADDETTTAEDAKQNSPAGAGKAVAKGSIVSFFRGGLAAVKLDDDYMLEETNDASPQVLSGMNVPGTGAAAPDRNADLLGHQVVFPNGSKGVVIAHRPPIVFVYNGGMESPEDGKVDVLGTMAPVPVADDVRVVGWDGQPMTPLPTNVPTRNRDMFAPIPQVKDIALINNPMLTGISLFDVLAPIGQGQNMLVVGHDLDEMRDYMCDFISTQVKDVPPGKEKPKVVYAAIDNSKKVVEKLHAAGVVDDVHVVLSSPRADGGEGVEEPAIAAEATAMAATACSIAESYAIEHGKDTLVIIDSLDQHKKLWDATTRVLVDVFGVDAVVQGDREGGASSEMRAFYSSIIQRAGQYKESKGGGSVTLLLLNSIPKIASGDDDTIYSASDFENSSEKIRARVQLLVNKNIALTAATLRKIDIPIPSSSEGQRRLVLQHVDDLVSMSDGQIWLDEKLQELGQSPPLDPQRSITRVGIGADTKSRADAPAIRKIAEGLRLAFSQAAHMDGAENTAASQKQIRRMQALLLAMHQDPGQSGRTLSATCTALLAASRGFLDDTVDNGKLAGTDAGRQLISGLLDHVLEVAPDAMANIDTTLDLSDDTEKAIVDVIKSYLSS